ncbi:MAG: SpoIIE family protein phosphatase [Defluviitaleaceae bacterium]|nr:SpoIIE family protein phosphatase [Defluviitaleaceae bacterium]
MDPSGKKRLLPLATKVTAIVLLIILINTAIIGVLSFIINRDESIRASSDKAMVIAKSASMSISPAEFRYALETGIKNEHYLHLEQQYNKVRTEENLAYFYAGTFDPVGWTDPEGRIDATTGETMIVSMTIYIEGTVFDLNSGVRRTMFRDSAFAAYESGETRVTDPYNFNVDGSKGIAAYAPIFDEGGQIIGLIGVLMPIDHVLERSDHFAMLMFGISLLIFAVIIWAPVFYLKNALAKPLSVLREASVKITKGEMDVNMPVRKTNDEVGLLSQNFVDMQKIVIGMQTDIKGVVENALNGNLSYRTNNDKYPGEWRELIVKFNSLMDTISLPIDEVAYALAEIANGNFNVRISSDYKGDFARIKKSVNSTAVDLDKYLTEKEKAESDAYKAELAKGQAEAVAEAMLSSARYARKIQRNLLPTNRVFDEIFADYSIIWEPRDVVGGDFYWLKNFGGCAVLCVCDCTGHGTPGALLTMLVASILEALVTSEHCTDTAQILYALDRRLAAVLNVKTGGAADMEINDGCDIVVMHISKDGSILMSAGNINVFACDGSKVTRHRGQSLFIGEGRLEGKGEVETVKIEPKPGQKFYVASDGLSDQIGGGQKKQFGYKVLEQIILENHSEKQETVTKKVWDAFEEYRGDEPRRDDFELISFKL